MIYIIMKSVFQMSSSRRNIFSNIGLCYLYALYTSYVDIFDMIFSQSL